MASATPRPTTSRKSPFTLPSAKPTGGKKGNAPKPTPANTRKGNMKTTAATGSKRKTKANSTLENKAKKPRAAGTRKKQKVDNTVDNSEVIDLSQDTAPQAFFGDEQQRHLSMPLETPMQPLHDQLAALQQLALFNMGPQQPTSAMMPRQRLLQSQQLPAQSPPQQRPMPPQQRSVPLQQPTPKMVSLSPPSHALPQQPSVPAQQHLPSILWQQQTMSHQQSSSHALPQYPPWKMPLQQSPVSSQSQAKNTLPHEQSMDPNQQMSDMLPHQSSIQPRKDSLDLSPQQDSSNLSPQQHPSGKKVHQPQSALVSRQYSPVIESHNDSPDLPVQQYQYIPIASHIADKIDPDFLNTPSSTIFDELVLIMIKQDPTLSPEHNIEEVTSAQLDKCAYAIWNECLFLREGQLIVHAAKYGSMYQDVKIRALGLMNLLPGWWFLREKVKQCVQDSGKWVDDKVMEGQFNLACGSADKILKSRARNKKEEEKDCVLGDFEVKKDEDVEYCYE